jgi:predicted nucleotidyltransferase
MGLREILKRNRDEILRIAARHGARNVRIFGSVARGDENESSDIDFLVEMEKGRSLLDRAGLLVELEALLKRKVDVATERTLRPPIFEHALKDAVSV